MTEIKIEKKKVLWPWIMGFVLLVLIIYLVVSFGRKESAQNDKNNEALTSLMDNAYPNESNFRLI